MYLACKNYSREIFLFAATVFFVSKIHSQNVSSPYSVLGIGDYDTKDYGRYFATGNASISRRDADSYNFSNPRR